MHVSETMITPSRVIWSFVAITFVKIAAFVLLNSVAGVAPFTGDNAVDHYVPIAQRLLSEGRFNGPDSRPDSKVPPAYSTVLAATMAIAPGRYPLIMVSLQMLADLGTAIVLFFLGRSFVGLIQAALAGALWLLYPPEVALSTWITAETLFTTGLVAATALMLWAMATRRTSLSFLAGILLGIATLLRGTTILLPLAFVPLAVWHRTYRWILPLLAGFVIIVGPWAIRNRIVLDDPILVAVGFGGAFMQGADEEAFTIDGKHPAFSRMTESAARAGIEKPNNDHEGEIDSWLFRVGLHRYVERVRTEPWSLVPFMAKKTLLLWFSTESGSFRGQLILALCSLPIVVPGLFQMWRWALAGTPFGAVLAVICGYFIVLHVATGPLNRYMLPVYPFLCLAASTWFLRFVDLRLHMRYARPSSPAQIPV